ncbi:MAG TPA: DUF2089 domain-containing protein [Chloroflexota bacterium]|nr:DUF2089 domain-containing protein [Chloroflexota bacterium]
MPEVTGRCPMCEGELVVTHLRCQQCGTGLEGVFHLNKFDRLSREQLRFVDVFIKNRGVIRDVERDLGISYPTVRGRLDEVIRALGYDTSGEAVEEAKAGEPNTRIGADRRRAILARLESGEVTAEQAIALLRGDEDAEAEDDGDQ